MKFTVINKIEPIENESLDSYLYRIGKANDYETANWYKIVFGVITSINPNQFSDPFLIGEVSKFLRFSSSRNFSYSTSYIQIPAIPFFCGLRKTWYFPEIIASKNSNIENP